MRPISISGLLVALSYFISFVLWADPPASEETRRISVREVIQKDDGARVDITGVVLRQVGPHTVLVHDGTAAVEVDIPPDQVPEGGLKPNVRIRIRGELVKEEETGTPELDANQVFWSF